MQGKGLPEDCLENPATTCSIQGEQPRTQSEESLHESRKPQVPHFLS